MSVKTSKSVVDQPVAVEPVAVEPVAVEPVAVEPVADQPVADQPVAVEPVAVEPVADQPVAVEPVDLATVMANALPSVDAVTGQMPIATRALIVDARESVPVADRSTIVDEFSKDQNVLSAAAAKVAFADHGDVDRMLAEIAVGTLAIASVVAVAGEAKTRLGLGKTPKAKAPDLTDREVATVAIGRLVSAMFDRALSVAVPVALWADLEGLITAGNEIAGPRWTPNADGDPSPKSTDLMAAKLAALATPKGQRGNAPGFDISGNIVVAVDAAMASAGKGFATIGETTKELTKLGRKTPKVGAVANYAKDDDAPDHRRTDGVYRCTMPDGKIGLTTNAALSIK